MSTILTQTVARLLVAPTFAVAAAILVKGYADVGDGFSAGAIAALGLLLQYVALGSDEVEERLPVRFVAPLTFAGLLGALVVAAVPLALGDPILTHRPLPGGDVVELGTLELVSAVAFDVAIFVLVLGAAAGIIRTIARTEGADPEAELEAE